jgi:GrpB-like predicted nucleotidyltransferase (UPF0157 family)
MAILVEYSKEWNKAYRDQSKLIKKTVGKPCVGTYHIGSTAIPGVPAQPVIDIMVLLKDVEAAKQLVALGYVESDDGTYTLQEPTISYKAYCVDMNDHDAIDAHMGILGKHRASKKDTQAWIELKQSWAQQFADDVQGYENAKNAYFEQIAPEAREKNQNDQKLGSSIAIGMCLGMGIGVALGSAMGNIGLGMCLGSGIGMCLGVALGSHKSEPKEK